MTLTFLEVSEHYSNICFKQIPTINNDLVVKECRQIKGHSVHFTGKVSTRIP